jgi:hypothetical protein
MKASLKCDMRSSCNITVQCINCYVQCDVDVVVCPWAVVYLEDCRSCCSSDENLKIRRVSLFVRREEILEKFRGIPSTLLPPVHKPYFLLRRQGYVVGSCGAGYLCHS